MQNWNQWQMQTGAPITAMPQPPAGYVTPGTDPTAMMQAYMQYYNQPAPSGYTAEQWAAAQQQSWTQWQQWQQQYQQWQQQYGEKYQQTMNQMSSQSLAPQAPPLPPPLPKEDTKKPPLPPNQGYPYQQSHLHPPNQNDLSMFSSKPGNNSQTNVNYPANPPLPTSQPPPPPDGERNTNDKHNANNASDPSSAKKTTFDGDELTDAEKTFDAKFKQWEEQFNKWKQQNANHPDKTQYKQYEAKWTSWREKLIERREQMRKKREQQRQATAKTEPAAKKDIPGGDKILNILSSTENQGLINNLLGIGKTLGLNAKQDAATAAATLAPPPPPPPQVTTSAVPGSSMTGPTLQQQGVGPMQSMLPMQNLPMVPSGMPQTQWNNPQWSGQYPGMAMPNFSNAPPQLVPPPPQQQQQQGAPNLPTGVFPQNFTQPPPNMSNPAGANMAQPNFSQPPPNFGNNERRGLANANVNPAQDNRPFGPDDNKFCQSGGGGGDGPRPLMSQPGPFSSMDNSFRTSNHDYNNPRSHQFNQAGNQFKSPNDAFEGRCGERPTLLRDPENCRMDGNSEQDVFRRNSNFMEPGGKDRYCPMENERFNPSDRFGPSNDRYEPDMDRLGAGNDRFKGGGGVGVSGESPGPGYSRFGGKDGPFMSEKDRMPDRFGGNDRLGSNFGNFGASSGRGADFPSSRFGPGTDRIGGDRFGFNDRPRAAGNDRCDFGKDRFEDNRAGFGGGGGGDRFPMGSDNFERDRFGGGYEGGGGSGSDRFERSNPNSERMSLGGGNRFGPGMDRFGGPAANDNDRFAPNMERFPPRNLDRFDDKRTNMAAGDARPFGRNNDFSNAEMMSPELKKLMEKRRVAMNVFKPSFGDYESRGAGGGSLSESFKRITGDSPFAWRGGCVPGDIRRGDSFAPRGGPNSFGIFRNSDGGGDSNRPLGDFRLPGRPDMRFPPDVTGPAPPRIDALDKGPKNLSVGPPPDFAQQRPPPPNMAPVPSSDAPNDPSNNTEMLMLEQAKGNQADHPTPGDSSKPEINRAEADSSTTAAIADTERSSKEDLTGSTQVLPPLETPTAWVESEFAEDIQLDELCDEPEKAKENTADKANDERDNERREGENDENREDNENAKKTEDLPFMGKNDPSPEDLNMEPPPEFPNLCNLPPNSCFVDEPKGPCIKDYLLKTPLSLNQMSNNPQGKDGPFGSKLMPRPEDHHQFDQRNMPKRNVAAASSIGGPFGSRDANNLPFKNFDLSLRSTCYDSGRFMSTSGCKSFDPFGPCPRPFDDGQFSPRINDRFGNRRLNDLPFANRNPDPPAPGLPGAGGLGPGPFASGRPFDSRSSESMLGPLQKAGLPRGPQEGPLSNLGPRVPLCLNDPMRIHDAPGPLDARGAAAFNPNNKRTGNIPSLLSVKFDMANVENFKEKLGLDRQAAPPPDNQDPNKPNETIGVGDQQQTEKDRKSNASDISESSFSSQAAKGTTQPHNPPIPNKFVDVNARPNSNTDVRHPVKPNPNQEFCIEKQFNYNHGGSVVQDDFMDYVPAKVIEYAHISRMFLEDNLSIGETVDYEHGSKKGKDKDSLLPPLSSSFSEHDQLDNSGASEVTSAGNPLPQRNKRHWIDTEAPNTHKEKMGKYEDVGQNSSRVNSLHDERKYAERSKKEQRDDYKEKERREENKWDSYNREDYKEKERREDKQWDDFREDYKEKDRREENKWEHYEKERDRYHDANNKDKSWDKPDKSRKDIKENYKDDERSKGKFNWQENANKSTVESLQETSVSDCQHNVADNIQPKTTDLDKIPSYTILEDLLCPPARFNRPSKIAIILRGPPGSGKSFLSKLIKDKEVEHGGSAPRILSLDDYFLTEKEIETVDDNGKKTIVKEMVYEYEEAMEQSYAASLIKAFKKNITDGFFNFIILDSINEKISDYEEMWNFAKTKGFKVYVCEMEMDVQLCLKRNVHNRTEDEINKIVDFFEPTPSYHQKLDVNSILQEYTIAEVQMEDSQEATHKTSSVNEDSQDSQEENSDTAGVSKWERMETEDKLNRLDGLAKRKNEGKPQTMEDFLQIPDYYNMEDTPGKKRVRWADLEERKQQEKLRAVGFVVGHTNWDRMMDPTKGGSALTRTKYI
ncbi:uncharacterized protein ZAP3 [Prorops nasuta]|uniref:uncharacterized protein ZAP3 n=1 Tax=Prorops nasuta TaxID=863751 RepID=UPI0034CE6B1F